MTLASGIAATVVMFNVLNNTLLRPLPIPDEGRVYRLLDWTPGPDGQPIRRSTRVHNFLAIQERTRSLDATGKKLELAVYDVSKVLAGGPQLQIVDLEGMVSDAR